jgi:SAM-dependent methyltransferase
MVSARQGSPGERYIHGHHESVLRSHQWRTVANSATYFAHAVGPGDLILDLGCGPGTLTVDLATVTGARVIGVDNAPAAIAAATTFATERSVAFSLADGYALPFHDHTFAGAHAHQVLQHSAQPVALLCELARVTRPGGVIGVRDATYSAFTWWPDVPAIDLWLELYLKLARFNDGEPDAGMFLATWVTEAGYRDLTVTTTSWDFRDEESCAWWGNLWADRITQSAFGAQLLELGWASRGELEELASAFQTWARTPGASFSVPSTEVLAFVS